MIPFFFGPAVSVAAVPLGMLTGMVLGAGPFRIVVVVVVAPFLPFRMTVVVTLVPATGFLAP